MTFSESLSLIWQTFRYPNQAAQQLQIKGVTWLPLFALAILLYLLFHSYFSHVDIDWYREYATAPLAEQFAPDRLAEIKQNMQPSTLSISMTVAGFLENLLIFAVFALYLHILAQLSKVKTIFFADWWRLVVWSAWPKIIGLIPAIGYLSVSTNSQIPLDQIQPLALTTWLDIESHSLKTALGLLNPFELWSLGLAVMFYRQWMNVSRLKSAVIILGPHILFIAYLAASHTP